MTLTRTQILTIGPVALVTLSYVIAAPSRTDLQSLPQPETVSEQAKDQNLHEPLSVRCQSTTKRLREQLDMNWNLFVREPFVLGGDLSPADLDQHYRDTIVPTSTVLNGRYFQRSAAHPITILICSTDERFRECNLLLEDQELSQYSGLYQRKHRRIIVNIASGEGTLAHELTHALAHADFPTMPEWFDEGLASLHEECEFSADGQHLIGHSNWRNKVAIDALNNGELRLIEDVTSKRFGSNGRANIDYAHVRSLCLYLQDRDLLEAFYSTCRAQVKSDPTGLRSLCQVTESMTPRAFDDAFRQWLIARQDK